MLQVRSTSVHTVLRHPWYRARNRLGTYVIQAGPHMGFGYATVIIGSGGEKAFTSTGKLGAWPDCQICAASWLPLAEGDEAPESRKRGMMWAIGGVLAGSLPASARNRSWSASWSLLFLSVVLYYGIMVVVIVVILISLHHIILLVVVTTVPEAPDPVTENQSSKLKNTKPPPQP